MQTVHHNMQLINSSENKQGDHSRFSQLDLLRVVASFLVILLHATSFGRFLSPSNVDWGFLVYFRVVSTFGVPLFVMLSGFLLLSDSKIPASWNGFFDFIFNRIKKIVLPTIFWSIVYIIWYKQSPEVFLGLFNLDQVTAGPDFIFYFIKVLYILYLAAPVLLLMLRGHRLSRPFLLLLFISGSTYYWAVSQSTILYYASFFGYFLLGEWLHMYLNIWTASVVKYWWMLLSAFLTLLIILVRLLYREISEKGFTVHGITATLDYTNPLVILGTVLLFCLVFTAAKNTQSKLVFDMSEVSFDVYFMHLIILRLVQYYLGKNLTHELIIAVVTFVLCYVLLLSWRYFKKTLISCVSKKIVE